MQIPRLLLVFALSLAACIDGDDPPLEDGNRGGGTGGPPTAMCPTIIGSCRVVYPQRGTYCSDIAVLDSEANAARNDCETNYTGSTWSTSRCSTTGTVGGCRLAEGGKCSTVWSFPPLTSEKVMETCTGTFVPPP